MLGPTNPDWRKDYQGAVRREFHEKFSLYDLRDRDPALEYYKKYRHYF